MQAAAKPTANSITGTGVTNPTNAYDGSANDPNTFAQAVATKTTIGSSLSSLLLTTFSPPPSFTAETIKISARALVSDEDLLGAYCRGHVSVDAGATYSTVFQIEGDSLENGATRVFYADISGATVSDVRVLLTVFAVSGGGQTHSSANLKIWDVWIEGTVPGGGFSGIPQHIGF